MKVMVYAYLCMLQYNKNILFSKNESVPFFLI